MLFFKSKATNQNQHLSAVPSNYGDQIKSVTENKCLGILIDDSLTFKKKKYFNKLKIKHGFYFRIKSYLSFEARTKLLTDTFMFVLDYVNVIYMNASADSSLCPNYIYLGNL